MKVLISYVYENNGQLEFGYEIANTVVDWVLNSQLYEGTYVLLNSHPLTEEEYNRFNQ